MQRKHLYSFKQFFWLKHLFWKLPIYSVNEVHVEKVEDKKCFDALTRWCEKNKDTMLMLLVKGGFENENEVKRRYGGLRRFFPVGLHTHLAIEAFIDEVSLENQYEAILYGVEFLKDCGVKVKDLTCGWFSFNSDTVEVCQILGLKLHIWYGQEWKVDLPIDILRIKKVLHDWELVDDIR